MGEAKRRGVSEKDIDDFRDDEIERAAFIELMKFSKPPLQAEPAALPLQAEPAALSLQAEPAAWPQGSPPSEAQIKDAGVAAPNTSFAGLALAANVAKKWKARALGPEHIGGQYLDAEKRIILVQQSKQWVSVHGPNKCFEGGGGKIVGHAIYGLQIDEGDFHGVSLQSEKPVKGEIKADGIHWDNGAIWTPLAVVENTRESAAPEDPLALKVLASTEGAGESEGCRVS